MFGLHEEVINVRLMLSGLLPGLAHSKVLLDTQCLSILLP